MHGHVQRKRPGFLVVVLERVSYNMSMLVRFAFGLLLYDLHV